MGSGIIIERNPTDNEEIEPGAGYRNKFFKELQVLAIIAILTLFSLIFSITISESGIYYGNFINWRKRARATFNTGYDVYISDQKVYFPLILHVLNPNLLQNDFLLSFNLNMFTFFDELIVFLVKTLNLDLFYVLFLLMIVARFTYFYSIYHIALYFTNDKLFSVYSILIFLSGVWVYGSTIMTMPIYLIPNFIGLTFNLLFLACYFNKKLRLSTLFLGIGMLIHIITSIPFLIFFYLELLFSLLKSRFRNMFLWSLGAIPILFLILILLNVDYESASLGLLTVIDPLWMSIIQDRTSCLFITAWDLTSFLYLLASIFLFIISRVELRELFTDTEKKRYLNLLIGIPIFMVLLSFITTNVMSLHFFTQLQLLRSFLLWKIIITLLFSYFAFNYVKTNHKDVVYNFSLLGITFSFILNEAYFFLFFPIFLLIWTKRKYTLLTSTYIKSIVIFGNFISIISSIWAFSIWPYLISYYTPMLVISALVVSLLVIWKLDLVFGWPSLYTLSLFILFFTIVALPKFSIYPETLAKHHFDDKCHWIKTNTAEDAVFITEPFTNSTDSIRLLCHRSVFWSSKDGALAMYNRESALEWHKRKQLLEQVVANLSLLSELTKEYDIDYIWSEVELDIPYPMVFASNIWRPDPIDTIYYYLYKIK